MTVFSDLHAPSKPRATTCFMATKAIVLGRLNGRYRQNFPKYSRRTIDESGRKETILVHLLDRQQGALQRSLPPTFGLAAF